MGHVCLVGAVGQPEVVRRKQNLQSGLTDIEA